MTRTLNLNDEVTVRLTERGRVIMLQSRWEPPERIPPAGEPCRVRMWVLMQALGPHMGMASPPLIERNRIELAETSDAV